MARRGRPRGARSTCSFCGEPGHNSVGGACSAGAIAERMVADGVSQSEAARLCGVTPSLVCHRIRRAKLCANVAAEAAERAELTKVAHESMEAW